MRRTIAAGLAVSIFTLSVLPGCGSTPVSRLNTARDASSASPLGPSYVLIPLPGEEDTLLGRILPALPEPGRALEEVARPNPCAKFLSDAKSSALSSNFEDAQELTAGAKASATLGTFGFGGDVDHATHFIYKLNTQKKVSRTDTTEYEECCAKKACGYGYVSALIYGDGEYATGEETGASATVDVAFASATGTTRLKVIHKRKVKGFLAAVVNITATAPDKAAEARKMTPFGAGFDVDIKEEGDSEMVKAVINKEKMSVESKGHDYFFKDGAGEIVTENEFARRFQKITGSDELGDVVSRRNRGSMVSSTIAIVVGGAGVGVGIPLMLSGCSSCVMGSSGATSDGTYKAGIFSLSIGGLIGGIGAYVLIAGLLSDKAYDGSETDHKLTEIDARVYVTQYNKALLKKTVKELQKAKARDAKAPLPTFQITPTIGAGGFGLFGRF
jgi:hypothetical protein